MASINRDVESRNCDQRGGIYVATIRDETNRLDLRSLRALIIIPGLMRSEATASISSLAYPGSFANK